MGVPAPDTPTVVDYGNAPEIWIDGMVLYRKERGIIRSAFYADKLVVIGNGETRLEREVVLKLRYSEPTQEQLRQYMIEALRGTLDAGFVEHLVESARH